MEIKNISPRSLDSEINDVELSDNIIDLMHYEGHLTQAQAKRTLELFPDLNDAAKVANYFFSQKIRKDFSSYESYLVYVQDARNVTETIFSEEVRVRSSGLPDTVLLSTGYRNSPWRNSHQAEHFASRDQGTEINNKLEREYIDRRINTGL